MVILTRFVLNLKTGEDVEIDVSAVGYNKTVAAAEYTPTRSH